MGEELDVDALLEAAFEKKGSQINSCAACCTRNVFTPSPVPRTWPLLEERAHAH